MDKVIMPFGKLFTCPKCGASNCGIEWQSSTFDEPKEGLVGTYEDEYKCEECGCHFWVNFTATYNCTYIDSK